MKKRLLSHLFAFMATAVVVCGVDTASTGVIVFADNGGSYPETRDFVSLKRTSGFFTTVVRANGQQEEIQNAGILGIFNYPTARPDVASAQATLEQINRLAAKYPRGQFPELAAKLNRLAVAWGNAKQAALSAPKPTAPLQSSSPATTKMSITTTDGRQYEDVTVVKVTDETISIEHSAGVATIPMAVLPPDLQKKYNYDPVRLAKLAEERKAAEAARVRLEAEKAAAIADKSTSSTSGDADKFPEASVPGPPEAIIRKGLAQYGLSKFAGAPFRRGAALESRGIGETAVGTAIYPVKFDGLPMTIYYAQDEFGDWKVILEGFRQALPVDGR